MQNKQRKQLWMGALAAGIVGTISTLVRLHRKPKKIQSQTIRGLHFNQKTMIGSMAGGIIGVATALLLAPTSGAKLLQGISHPISKYLNNSRSTTKKSTRSHASKKKVSPLTKEPSASRPKAKAKSKKSKRAK